MPVLKAIVFLTALASSGCTSMQRLAHVYSGQAPEPNTYRYADGGTSLFYTFTVGDNSQPDTFVFFYGGSGCPSWKYVMPGYVDGLSVPARVFVLNKRFVSDLSTGLFGCGEDFHLANNPDRWVADYSQFIVTQLKSASHPPRNVVLVGVSEGALPARRVAGQLPAITHLAIIGAGGYSMRTSLSTLARKGAISFDVTSGWKRIVTDPTSIEKSWYGNPYRWWSDIMDVDPVADFLKLNIPILVGMGEQDESVPVESARFLESKFKQSNKGNLMLKVYPGADHRLYGDGVSHRGDFFAELSRLLRPPHNIALKRHWPDSYE